MTSLGPRPVPNQLERSSWWPVDLSLTLNGKGVPPPSLLRMDTGQALLYRGRANGVHGEPEGGKSWLGFITVAQILDANGRALYVDYEDDEVGVVERLRALGVQDSVICSSQFCYVHPDEPLEDPKAMSRAARDLAELLSDERMFDLAVVDSYNEGMMVEGLNPLDNLDSGIFYARLIRHIISTGCGVLNVDHVVKNVDNRGSWALGAQHKRAMIRGASYQVEIDQPFGRGRTGSATIKVAKDTPGHVRRSVGPDKVVATLSLSSDPTTERLVYRLQAPEAAHSVLVDRLVAFLRTNPGASKRALRGLGNSDTVDAVLANMTEEGVITVVRTGTIHAHFLAAEE